MEEKQTPPPKSAVIPRNDEVAKGDKDGAAQVDIGQALILTQKAKANAPKENPYKSKPSEDPTPKE